MFAIIERFYLIFFLQKQHFSGRSICSWNKYNSELWKPDWHRKLNHTLFRFIFPVALSHKEFLPCCYTVHAPISSCKNTKNAVLKIIVLLFFAKQEPCNIVRRRGTRRRTFTEPRKNRVTNSAEPLFLHTTGGGEWLPDITMSLCSNRKFKKEASLCPFSK